MSDRHTEQTQLVEHPLGPLYVKQGVNNYEWFVYEGSVRINPHALPAQREAIAWMGGYEAGRMHEPS